MASGVVAEVVEAFEINDSANDVYQHNFKHRPYQVSSLFSNSSFVKLVAFKLIYD